VKSKSFLPRTVIEPSLQLANVLKLNDSELPVLATLFDLKGDPQSQLTALAQRFDLRVVALTLGPQGSLLYQGGRWSKCGTRPVRVQDTVGAGDAFTAALALGLLRQMDLEAINLAANEVASYVCSCAGATPTPGRDDCSDPFAVRFCAAWFDIRDPRGGILCLIRHTILTRFRACLESTGDG
jgi:sugar/nucleoside kinase (ribokinase family)